MAFNKALKEARLRAGYTQQQVSAEAHIPLGTLRRWEQGVNEPDTDSLVALLDLYGASADEVLGSGFCAPGLRPGPRSGRAASPRPLSRLPSQGPGVHPADGGGHQQAHGRCIAARPRPRGQWGQGRSTERAGRGRHG